MNKKHEQTPATFMALALAHFLMNYVLDKKVMRISSSITDMVRECSDTIRTFIFSDNFTLPPKDSVLEEYQRHCPTTPHAAYLNHMLDCIYNDKQEKYPPTVCYSRMIVEYPTLLAWSAMETMVETAVVQNMQVIGWYITHDLSKRSPMFRARCLAGAMFENPILQSATAAMLTNTILGMTIEDCINDPETEPEVAAALRNHNENQFHVPGTETRQ